MWLVQYVLKLFVISWMILFGVGTLTGCQQGDEPDTIPDSSLAEPVASPKLPQATPLERTTAQRLGTVFTEVPENLLLTPRLMEIPIPEFPGAHAIWGATGRDDRGHLWFGVAGDDHAHPSAHLYEYVPQLDSAFDRGNVVEQLKVLGLLRPGESQMKIHSKIVAADDGYLYFASMDETGESGDGSNYPTWGGHLWRMKPFASRWEHLLATKEALIAVGGFGRWIHALGYFKHVLYQYDTQTGKVSHVEVGSVGGHVSRNFLVDQQGHAYVPRVKQSAATTPSTPPTKATKPELTATLVEFDEHLTELQEIPLADYEPTADFESHGIIGWTSLANGDLLFTTTAGGLWRIHPAEPRAEISRLGDFHPEGRSYPSVLSTYDGTRYACGFAQLPEGHFDWVVYDLLRNDSRAMKMDQEPLKSSKKLLLYGSHTRDNEGNAYVVGRIEKADAFRPILLKAVFPK